MEWDPQQGTERLFQLELGTRAVEQELCAVPSGPFSGIQAQQLDLHWATQWRPAADGETMLLKCGPSELTFAVGIKYSLNFRDLV